MTKSTSNGKKNGRPEKPARRQSPGFQELLRQGTRALQQGQPNQAVRLLEQAHRLDRDNPDAALNLSGAYILVKKFKRAVDILEPMSRREPDNPMVWTNLGAAYLGNPVLAGDEQQQRAITAFKKALELDPATPHVAYNLGLIYLDRHEQSAALHWFHQAVLADPHDRDAQRYINGLSDKQ